MPDIEYCAVAGDNLAGGALATRHLIATGRRRIAFVNSDLMAIGAISAVQDRG